MRIFLIGGESSYFQVELNGRVPLQQLLSHLYVLVPVLDNDKHYWVGDDEVEKLLRHGEGWLASHPEREAITRRYLKHQRSLVDDALAQLTDEDEPNPDAVAEAHAAEEETIEQRISLNEQRLGAVLAALKSTGAARILDLGCGEGKLLQALLKEKQFTEIVGMDVSHRALEIAHDRLHYDRLPPVQKERLRLLHGSLIYRDQRLAGFDSAAVPEPEWLNRTINIDTGCVFGGKLTAMRYPEKELVSVPARQTYAESRKPFLPPENQAPTLSAQQQHDDLLDLADVTGKRIVSTRLHGNVTIREENSIAALEVMSRFAANPKWLIYLPPTMSPSETTKVPGLLEHPAEAFAYFRHAGVPRVVCEEKHMGSRAVVIVCRDEDAARKTFGVTGEGIGICYTRTGRRFFDNTILEGEFLGRVRAAATAAEFWDEFKTDWLCLDCELMPWSAKAQELLKQQYAAVGASAHASLADEVTALNQAAGSGLDVAELLAHTTARQTMVSDYIAAYRRYCWPVESVSDLKLAPFHLLATEGKAHADKPHDWHMQTLARLAGGIIVSTPFHVLDVTNPESEAAGIRWWEELTGHGGEGMVVKPLEFIAKNRRGPVQPAVKCRGREYLRIIYGPEYTAAENLERLRARGLSTKRSLALREFALGIESLERFVRKEPLRRVHEAVFGVLALESEPVDPRL